MYIIGNNHIVHLKYIQVFQFYLNKAEKKIVYFVQFKVFKFYIK